jgi:hypothetical protein
MNERRDDNDSDDRKKKKRKTQNQINQSQLCVLFCVCHNSQSVFSIFYFLFHTLCSVEVVVNFISRVYATNLRCINGEKPPWCWLLARTAENRFESKKNE